MLRPILIVALALASAACTSSRAVENERIPLRLGVLPIEQEIRLEDPAEGAISIPLELDSSALTERFATELGDSLFVDAIELDVPPLEPAAGPAVANQDRVEARWNAIRAAAAEAGVDAVIRAELVYSKAVRTGPNEKLWLNLPLFLIGGPLNWFPNDRSYFVRADLEFVVYDAIALEGGQLRGLEEAALVRARGSADEIELDVFDRAGGNVGQYALGILVPGVWLARETDQAARTLAEEVTRALTEDAIEELRRDSDRLVRNQSVVAFYPDLELRPSGDGYTLGGEVMLVGESVPELDWLSVATASRELATARFGPESAATAGDFTNPARRYPVDLPLAISRADAVLGLRVRIEDKQGNARTYTYAAR